VKVVGLVLALVVAVVPVAEARTAKPPARTPKCAKQARKGPHKRQRRCTRSHPTVRPPQTAGGPVPTVTPPAVTDPAPSDTTTGPVSTPTTRARLGVVAREFSLVLSRAALPAGSALVELQNFGQDAHNLRIARVDGAGAAVDVPLAEAGEVKSATATLTPGTYKLYCALPGHDAQGMHALLTVGS
jgi:plastocyanin